MITRDLLVFPIQSGLPSIFDRPLGKILYRSIILGILVIVVEMGERGKRDWDHSRPALSRTADASLWPFSLCNTTIYLCFSCTCAQSFDHVDYHLRRGVSGRAIGTGDHSRSPYKFPLQSLPGNSLVLSVVHRSTCTAPTAVLGYRVQ